MNPFVNPIFLSKAIKGYITNIGRLRRLNERQLRDYKDKVFRKSVKYAYTVPIYHKKYKKAGIHPSDIKKIKDIEKLPFITKDDFRKNYPYGLIPSGFNKEKGFLLSTSGSTGKPISIYRDMNDITQDLWGFIRELREYNISWFRNRLSFIADLTPDTAGSAYMSFNSDKKQKTPFLSFKNFQTIDIGDNINDIMKKLDNFKPDFINGYPNILHNIALLKNKGHGEKIKPLCIQSNGAVLSSHTREVIEKAFDCKVYDSYSSTEAGPTAFECREGKYHIHEDLVHLDFVDKNMNPVDFGKPGHLVLTKLNSAGTPIIRYTGNDDIITPIKNNCSCGTHSMLIENIGGRSIDTILLPDGRIIEPLSITGIPHHIMHENKTDKIQQFQIIQRKIDEIEILIVISEKLRDEGPSVKKLIDEIKNRYKERLGKKVYVVVKEVDDIEKTGSDRIVRQVISLVDHNSN